MSRFSLCVLSALLLGSVAYAAGATSVPEWRTTSDEDTSKAIRMLGFTTEGKAEAYPKKIAIPYFVVRYDKTQVTADAALTTVRFSTEEYVQLTDALYDALVARFTAYGFEVVPKEQVIAASAYKALEGETGNDEGSERIRGVPTGMKFLGQQGGQPTRPNDLAALNKELGTDAVVAVFANFGFCPIAGGGTLTCMRGNMLLPGLSMLFQGGSTGEGKSVKPTWTSRAYKQVVEFEYKKASVQVNGETAEVYDAALISGISPVSWNKAGFWGNKTGDPEAGAFAQGVAEMFDAGVILGMETFFDKNEAALASAGVQRPARPATASAFGAANLTSVKDLKAEAATALADLEKMKAEALSRPEGAPVAGGVVSCYHVDAQPPSGNETLLKRGYEAGRVVDETLALAVGVGPVPGVSIYTVGDGTFDVKDGKSTWTGKGTFEGPADAWSAWKGVLSFSGGYSADVTGTTEAAGLHVVTQVKGPDGKVATSFDQHYTKLEPAACDAAWAAMSAYVAPPIPGTPEAKKAKKGK